MDKKSPAGSPNALPRGHHQLLDLRTVAENPGKLSEDTNSEHGETLVIRNEMFLAGYGASNSKRSEADGSSETTEVYSLGQDLNNGGDFDGNEIRTNKVEQLQEIIGLAETNGSGLENVDNLTNSPVLESRSAVSLHIPAGPVICDSLETNFSGEVSTELAKDASIKFPSSPSKTTGRISPEQKHVILTGNLSTIGGMIECSSIGTQTDSIQAKKHTESHQEIATQCNLEGESLTSIQGLAVAYDIRDSGGCNMKEGPSENCRLALDGAIVPTFSINSDMEGLVPPPAPPGRSPRNYTLFAVLACLLCPVCGCFALRYSGTVGYYSTSISAMITQLQFP